jgi:hypothetical protein
MEKVISPMRISCIFTLKNRSKNKRASQNVAPKIVSARNFVKLSSDDRKSVPLAFIGF